LPAFKSSISDCFKSKGTEKLYSILDKLIEGKRSEEITDIYSKVLSLLNSHTSEAEILKSLENLKEDPSIQKIIQDLSHDFLKKVPSEYLEKERGVD
jgi:F0F1-type ATP synthase delta subunit